MVIFGNVVLKVHWSNFFSKIADKEAVSWIPAENCGFSFQQCRTPEKGKSPDFLCTARGLGATFETRFDLPEPMLVQFISLFSVPQPCRALLPSSSAPRKLANYTPPTNGSVNAEIVLVGGRNPIRLSSMCESVLHIRTWTQYQIERR
jgi:hypothetical protein